MDKLSQIALSMTPGLGPTSIRRLLDVYPGQDVFELPATELYHAFGTHRDVAGHIVGRTAFGRAEEELRFCERNGIRALFCTDDDFPQRLNREDTGDAPVLLYVKGALDLNRERSVAIVGTRRATPQGRDNTHRLVRELIPMGPTVVSGLAYGIDTAAHSAAVEYGLPTVAVLGHGLDRIYPPSNRRLAIEILEKGGALVTEYPSDTAINPRYFPARNRIIASLADATVVVEASAKGGALITAALATGYHREVFAVPGRPTDTYSVGTNNLIATQRALLVRDGDDVAYQMGWPLSGRQATAAEQQTLFPTLKPEEQRIVDLLRQYGQLPLDEMVAMAAMPMPQVAALLFNLELAKVVRVLPGRLYQLVS